MFIVFIIVLININCEEILKIRTPNLLTGDTNYTCILNIEEITKLNENINYIIFDFKKEKKENRNNVYISSKESETNNIGTIFKLPLYNSNKIIIPYDYIKLERKLFIKLICFEKNKCDEEIYIDVVDKIQIENDEILYINGFKEKYIYNFIYKNKNNIDKNNIYKQFSAYSYQKNDFELKIIKNNQEMNSEHIMNGYLLTDRDKENSDSTYDINIIVKKPSAYIILQIISINNNIKYNSIELMRPIIGILNNNENERCFYIDENEKNGDDYLIDFMIENQLNALSFDNNNNHEPKNILFSQTINYFSEDGKFCIKKLYPNKESIYFYFTVYIPSKDNIFSYNKPKQYNIQQPYLGLLHNGYFYKKIDIENTYYKSFFPSEYNSNILYFYIYAIRGIIKVSNSYTNNFPYDNEENIEFKNIENIGNEYFGKIVIKDPNVNSSPVNSNKNIVLVKCESGVKFSEETNNFCIYNIILYTEKDLLLLTSNEKFSYINSDKINLNIQIEQNFEINKNKMIIDTYSHFGSSYIEIINKDENSNLNIFYNGNLINNEIVYNFKNNKDKYINYNYKLKAVSYDYDYVSIIITGNIDSEGDILKTRFWINDYILTTLTKRIPKKHFIIDHIPNAVTDVNFYKTFSLFKYSNCDVETKLIYNKTIMNNFQNIKNEKLDDIQLISFEGYHSESKNIIEFEFELKNIYNNEPVCMIYFTSFFQIDMNLGNFFLNPILLKENIETPIFENSQDFIVQLEYIIFNYDSPLIISLSFEEMLNIYFSYSIEDSKVSKLNIYQSQNIIIYQKEIKEKCLKDNEENKLCKLKIDITKNDKSIFKSKYFKDKPLLYIKIKSNYENHVSYLNLNTVTDGMILDDQFQYYYTNIRQYDSGIIALNNKKGTGIMYARIINKNTKDINNNNNWNGRIHLLSKKELEKCEDCLIYNINTNEIIINEEDTKDCISDLRCQIIIGVANIENKDEDNANEYSVYEYSIYFLKNNIKNNIFGNLKIQQNKYIKSSLDKNGINNNKIIYEYYLPDNVENIKYELQCNSCYFSLIDGNNKIKQKIQDENIIKKFGTNIIQFPNNDITKFYNKIIYFEFSSDEKDLLFFRISLIFNGTFENLSFLTSEMNSICYDECYYLIPIYDYDKLTSLTMSVSDKNLNGKVKTELDFKIYDTINYYSYIMFKQFTYEKEENYLNIKPNIENLSSKKNYLVFENKNKYKNMSIVAHVKIKQNFDINKLHPYYVYFTYSKNSRKNYFLYPNINNLLYINKNSETENIKEVRIPDYYLIKNSKSQEKSIYSSIVTFSHIKGEGVIELITNNIYLHNNIKKVYTELKSFRFDKSHSFFQINYDNNSNFTKKFVVNSNTGLYTYANIKSNLEKNINEIKLGKANYILHRYDGNTKYLYIKIDNMELIKNDIYVDIKIEGLDVYNDYDISLKGYISNEENFINNNIFLADGFYDSVINIGILKFLSKDMKQYYKEDKLNYLLVSISFDDKKNQQLDIMIKATPLTSVFVSLNDEKFEISIPQFEHFFSYIDFSINNYIIFKLNTINKTHNYISIELHLLNDEETEFSLHSDKSHLIDGNKEYLFKNETNTNSFNIVDERNQNGKRSIILNLKNEIKEIYLVIFMDNKKNNLDKEFFSVKYYGLTNNDYQDGKYLYKKRFIINNTKININKEEKILNWEKIQLMNLKEEKGEIKIDYFLKIFTTDSHNKEIKYNYGLFNNFIKSKDNLGIHLINKNEYQINSNINIDDNLKIYLIAKFNEISGMENFLLYEPLLLTKKNQISDNSKNKEINNNMNNKKFVLQIFIIILIIIVIVLIILSVFKFIRKIQIKKAYNKYIKGNAENLKGNLNLFGKDKLPFESKISFLIEN